MSIKSKSKRDSKKRKAKHKIFKKKSLHTKQAEPITHHPSMTMLNNPLSNLTKPQRKKIILDLSQNSRDRVDELFNSLNKTLKEYDPITLISILSCYGLTIGVGDKGVVAKESSGGLNQSHVELLQALMLQIPEDELGCKLVAPGKVQEVWEELIELSKAFHFSRMNEGLIDSSKKEFAINQIQEIVRGNTQSVRNWGFYSQVTNISKEIYSFFDDMLVANIGFSASNVIDIFILMTQSIEELLTLRLQALTELKSTKKKYDLLLKYHELIGQGKDEADKFAASIDLREIPLEQLFFKMLSHFDLRVSENYFVNVKDIAHKLKIEEKTVLKILNKFSFSFGELSDHKKEFFFLDNPIWSKPVVKTNKGYFCALPQQFFSFVLNTLDELIELFDKSGLHKRRADYLEAKIEEIVKRRFPSSKTVTGLKWVLGEAQYETDLITFIDSHALIIEAKSHKISKTALRGAPDRIKRHLKEILVEPSVQSLRLEQRLNDLRLKSLPNDSLIDQLPVDIKTIHKVIRVSVSLENFASLQASLGLFNDTGWLPHDFLPCPSMNIADFETLFDFLEHPVQIIHYLERRTELEGIVKFLGDELDFMGLYIETLLNTGDVIADNQGEVIISGKSEPLDKYYISKDQGIIIDKPRPKISPLFRKIFQKLEERGMPRWTEIGCILNRFPPYEQVKLTRLIENLSKAVKKSWQVEGHKNTAIYSPPYSSEYALAVVLYKDENNHRRYEFIEQASNMGIEPRHVKYCLTIAINIDNNDLPYHYIALAESPKGD